MTDLIWGVLLESACMGLRNPKSPPQSLIFGLRKCTKRDNRKIGTQRSPRIGENVTAREAPQKRTLQSYFSTSVIATNRTFWMGLGTRVKLTSSDSFEAALKHSSSSPMKSPLSASPPPFPVGPMTVRTYTCRSPESGIAAVFYSGGP